MGWLRHENNFWILKWVLNQRLPTSKYCEVIGSSDSTDVPWEWCVLTVQFPSGKTFIGGFGISAHCFSRIPLLINDWLFLLAEQTEHSTLTHYFQLLFFITNWKESILFASIFQYCLIKKVINLIMMCYQKQMSLAALAVLMVQTLPFTSCYVTSGLPGPRHRAWLKEMVSTQTKYHEN